MPEALVAKWPKAKPKPKPKLVSPKPKPKPKKPVKPKTPPKPQTGAEARERILSDKRSQALFKEQDALDHERITQEKWKEDALNRLHDKSATELQRSAALKDFSAARRGLVSVHTRQKKLDPKFASRGNVLRRQLLEHDGPVDKIEYDVQSTVLKDTDRARLGVEAFQKLVPSWGGGQKGLVARFGSTKRAHYSENGTYGTVGLGKGSQTKTIVHELGHAWEGRSVKNLQQSVDHLYNRTKGEKLQTMAKATGNTAYASTEKTRPNKFFNAYAGKDYSEHWPPQTVANLNAKGFTYVPSRDPGTLHRCDRNRGDGSRGDVSQANSVREK